MSEKTEIYKENVEKKLIIRQIIFIAIILILVVISVFNVIGDRIDPTLAVSGFFLSIVVGLAMSRMFKIFWHEEKGKVVSQLDVFGTVLLVAYIAVEVGRKWIFQHWLTGAQLNAFGLIVLSGLLLGRFLGTGVQIKSILTEQDIIESK